jgi:hypothetical protein
MIIMIMTRYMYVCLGASELGFHLSLCPFLSSHLLESGVGQGMNDVYVDMHGTI